MTLKAPWVSFGLEYLFMLQYQGFVKIISWKFEGVQRYDLADERTSKRQEIKRLGKSFDFGINKNILLFTVSSLTWDDT